MTSKSERSSAVTTTDEPNVELHRALSYDAHREVGLVESIWDSPFRQRHGSRIVLLCVLMLILAPIVTWLRYESAHVMSTNAIVRGNVAEIGTQLEGVVTSVEVDAGDSVVGGQLLAQLESRPFLAAAQEVRAQLRGLELEVEVEKLEIAHARRQLDQKLVEVSANATAAEAETVAARIRAEDARRAHELRRDLFAESGAISGEIVRDAETNQRTSEALLRASEAGQIAALSERDKTQLETDALIIRERRIGILEAEIQRAEAQLERAELDLESTKIRAPESGAIIRRIIQPGGSVDVGQPIISMWLGGVAWVEAWVDENDIHDVAVGNRATVTLHAVPGREFFGTVSKIGLTTDFEMPEADVPLPRFARMRGTPVVGVRIDLDDPPAELLPGLSAIVAINRSAD